MTPTQRFIAAAVVLLAIIGGLYYYSTRPQAGTSSSISTSTNALATSTATSTTSTKPTLVTPDYSKPIAFSSSVTPDIQAQLDAELSAVQADLAKNPLSIKDWVDLGTLHKMGGDYTNAALYWEFVASYYSGTGVPYYSLGELYDDFLNNTAKAEADYKLAIQVDPHNVNAYAALYTMYHYKLHNDTKAGAILAAGLAQNPGNNYLLGLQSELASSTHQ